MHFYSGKQAKFNFGGPAHEPFMMMACLVQVSGERVWCQCLVGVSGGSGRGVVGVSGARRRGHSIADGWGRPLSICMVVLTVGLGRARLTRARSSRL